MQNNVFKGLKLACLQVALSASLSVFGGSSSYYRVRRGDYSSGNKQYLADPGLVPLSNINFPEGKKAPGALGGMDQDVDLDFHFEKGQKIKELLIVDGAVQNKSVFLSQDRPGVDIIEIESGKSGIVQLLAALTQYQNLEAVHVISHAKSGTLQLGNDMIEARTFEENAGALAALNGAIKPGGDLLFYGCELAKGAEGQRFLEAVKGNYDFDIAASNDPTGNVADKANWDLEIQTGDIEATPLPESIALNDFTGVLQFSGTIGFDQIKTTGSFGGAATINAEFYTSASKEYTLVADGSVASTGAYTMVGVLASTNPVGVFSSTTETTLRLNFSNNETFDATSLVISSYSGASRDFEFTSDGGSSMVASAVTVGNVAKSTVNFTANNTGITYIDIKATGGAAFYVHVAALAVANVSAGGDTTPPQVTSIVRQSPTDATTNATSATFRVTFDEDVQNVSTDGSDFAISGAGAGGTATITGASSVSASIYDVTVGSINTDGLLDLGFAGGQDIQDLATNAFGGTNNGSEQTYTIDQTGATSSTPDLATSSDSGNEEHTAGATSDNRTNDLTPTFTGTTEVGASVTVSSSVAGSLGSASVDGSGNWTFTPMSDLATGVHTITAQATDALGNTGAASSGLPIIIDNTGPTVTLSSTSSPGPTNDNPIPLTITFSEEAENLKENDFTLSNGTTGDFASGDSTTFTLNVTPAMDGTVTVDLNAGRAFDLAGNPNTAATQFSIVYDGTAPVFSAVSPATSGSINTANIGYTLSEAITSGTVTFTQTGGTADPSSPHVVNLTGTELNSGTRASAALTNAPTLVDGAIYTIAFNGTDAAGNTATTVSSTGVTFDTTVPTISGISPATNDFINALDVTYTLSEAAASGQFQIFQTSPSATFIGTFALTGSELNTGTFSGVLTNAPSLVNGSIYQIGFQVTDAAGNASSTFNQGNITFDTSAPTISSSTPADNATGVAVADDITITFNENMQFGTGFFQIRQSSDDGAIFTIDASDPSGTTNVASISGATLTINPGTSLAAETGYYVFIVSGTPFLDLAGNAFSGLNNNSDLNFTTVDVTAPTLTNQALAQTAADDLQITYQSDEAGTLYYVVTTNSSAPSTAQIKAGNDQSGTSTNVVSSGNAAVTVTGSDQTIALNGLTLASTTYHLFIYEEDATGNESGVVTNSASIDATAPTLINQALAQTAADDLQITYQSDEAGTLYYVVTTNSSTPTQAQILAGNDQSGTSTNVVSSGNAAVTVTGSNQTIALNGLTLASTTYHLFIYESDAIGNQSSVVTNSAAIDATAPTLTNQALAQTAPDDLQITYQSDETGTLYYIVTTNSSTPSTAQILAGNDQSGTSTNVVSSGNAAVTVTGSNQTIALNGLTLASTTYHLFIYESDAIGNASSVVTNSAAADVTAPTLINQALAQTAPDDLEITYQSDETGTLYYVVTTNSSTPSTAQILAGNDQSGTSTNVVSSGNAAVTVTGSNQTIALNGLTLANTTYHLFIYESDAIGNVSSVVTNSAATDVTAPTLINQALAQTAADDLQITYQSNEAGTLYYVVTTNSSTPTTAQILAGNDQSGTSTNVVSSGNAAVTVTGSNQTIALNGLTLASTTYHLFIYESDAIGNQSSVVTNSAAIDATAPTLINQALAQTAADDLQITYQSDETGTLYYVVTTNSSTPTTAQILAGNDQSGTSTNVVSSGNAAVTVTGSNQTIALNGLTLASTTYHLFIYESDAIGNQSSVVTNSAAIDATAPTLTNQALAQTAPDDLQITYQSDETGTLYYVVTTNSSTPSTAQILAGNDQSGTSTNVISSGNAAVTVTGSNQTIALNGLTLASTTYHLFIYESDAIGNASSVVTNSVAADVTAPTLINQALAQTAADDLEITYQSDESGTLYYVVTTNSSTPTTAQILAGNDQSGTSTNVVSSGNAAVTVTGSNQTIALNGLTLASTTYHLFIYEADAIGNASSVVTNSAAIDATAPTLTNQALAQTAADDLQITYQSNETGTLYYVVTTNSSTPTTAQIFAGNDQSGTSTNVVSSGNAAVTVTGSNQTVALNGLTLASTTYHLFIYEADAIGNQSSVVTNSTLVDATAPTVTSIVRLTPTNELTNVSSVTFRVTFNENVTGVSTDGSDFAISGAGAGGTASIANATEQTASTVFDVQVNTINTDGELDLDFAAGQNITDNAGNAYALAITTEETYTIDQTAPTIAISTPIEGDGLVNATEDGDVTISGSTTGTEDGQTVSISITDGSSTPVTGTATVTSNAWTITADADISGLNEGTITITADVSDAAGNAATQASQTVTLDNTAPAFSAVSPSSSSFVNTTNVGYTLSEAIASGTVTYTQTSGTTDGSSPHTVTLTGTELNTGTRASAALTNAPTLVDGAVYTIAFNGADAAGNAAATVSSTGVTFDTSAPSTTSFTRKTPTDEKTNADAVTFLATFSEDVMGVDMNDFAVTGPTGASISVSQVTASTYDVQISGGDMASLDATVGLNFNSPSITDLAGNALPNTEPGTDQTYTLDNTAPTITISTPIEGDGIVQAAESSDVEISGSTTGLEDGQSVTVSFSDGSTTAGPVNATVTSNAWTASLADISALNDGSITVTADVSDVAGNAALQASQTITLDQAPPTISVTAPGDDVTNVDIEADITITFNENIQFGTGNIVLNDLDNSTTDLTIDASSPGSAATISGAVLTINNPGGFLEESRNYAIQIANTAITDIGGNAFAGIANNTTYNFTTEAPPTISIADATLAEGNSGTANMTFAITLDKTSPKTITLSYATSDNTATTADNDYTAVTATTLTFNPSETSKNVTVAVNGDTRDEDAETFFLDGTSPTNASFADNQGQGTITDDDDPPTVAFSTTTSSGAESVTSADVTVEVATASSKTITVDYAVTGTATGSGTDYELANGTLTFNADDVSETITIAGIVDDAILETNETVIITLSNPTNASLGANTTHTYTITENDNAAVTIADASLNEADGTVTLTATLDNQVQGGFNVTITSADGTASQTNGDYTAVSETLTFAGTSGETQTFTVTVTDDAILEANETITLSQGSLSTSAAVNITDGATVTINNDDNATVTIADASGNEDDGNITVTLTLDSQVDGGLTVDVSTADGTATTGDSDYTAVSSETVTFTGTAGETQTVTVAATTDAKVEANETLTVSMSNVTATTVATSSITSSDTGTITITNDDAAAVTIADASGAEDAGAITLTATLDNSVDGGFTVDVSTADGTATSGDYTSIEGQTLTFAGTAGETQTFTVTPTSDETVESDETVTVSMGSLAATSLAVTITDNATVTITNDDNAPVITAGQTFPIEGILTAGQEIGTVVATDADDGTTFSAWTIVSGNTDNAFAIAAGTGVLTVNDPSVIDLIATPSYTLTLTVSDGTNTSAQETVTIEVGDGIAPTVTLSSDVGDVTNVSPISITATFSELVLGFELSDLTLVNATAANLVANDAQTIFTFDLTPEAEGNVSVNVAAGVATDAVGNLSEASNTISYFYDVTAPTATLTTTADAITGETSGRILIDFSEMVTGLEIEDIQTSSGTLSNFNGSMASYQVDITGLSEGTAIITVPAGSASDAAGNGNTEGSVSWEVDLTGPSGFTVDILNPAINDLNEDNFRFRINGAEPRSTFNYTINSSGGGTAVTGTGELNGNGQGGVLDDIDVSGLGDGTLTLSVEMIDEFGNLGAIATDEIQKNTEDGGSNGIAQGYSPNGDNIDDTWTIPGIEDLPNNVVTIFNRYGTKVWETTNYDNNDNAWDSQANVDNIFGSAGLPDGTYFYVIEFPGTNTDSKSGFVILKR